MGNSCYQPFTARCLCLPLPVGSACCNSRQLDAGLSLWRSGLLSQRLAPGCIVSLNIVCCCRRTCSCVCSLSWTVRCWQVLVCVPAISGSYPPAFSENDSHQVSCLQNCTSAMLDILARYFRRVTACRRAAASGRACRALHLLVEAPSTAECCGRRTRTRR